MHDLYLSVTDSAEYYLEKPNAIRYSNPNSNQNSQNCTLLHFGYYLDKQILENCELGKQNLLIARFGMQKFNCE